VIGLGPGGVVGVAGIVVVIGDELGGIVEVTGALVVVVVTSTHAMIPTVTYISSLGK
jgi:hypothetical protein